MKILSGLILMLFFTSCATMLNEDTQKINVQTSNNTKAKIEIDGRSYDVPGVVELRREKKDLLVKSKNNKCTKEMILKHEVDSKFWINILSGGTFGSSTDYNTGKMWKYADNVVIQCQ